jgi:hypothetical protein
MAIADHGYRPGGHGLRHVNVPVGAHAGRSDKKPARADAARVFGYAGNVNVGRFNRLAVE